MLRQFYRWLAGNGNQSHAVATIAPAGTPALPSSHNIGTPLAFDVRATAGSAQRADRGRSHVAVLSAETDTQIIGKISGLLIA